MPTVNRRRRVKGLRGGGGIRSGQQVRGVESKEGGVEPQSTHDEGGEKRRQPAAMNAGCLCRKMLAL